MAKRPAIQPARTHGIRCAIYTRKSTEEGLDQEFNSLDAQREACAAYILSQKHEGWSAVREAYDDGGFSGGSMERPGLKRLLADVEAGRVDVIVVYKVDRLTRALSDFAKIVEILDARGASFVSVTQAFNTTTSMGRLTLNVLLSFAQFEREVTGERIRDKIAASRKKGMWMGGSVPLGYAVQDRKLVVCEPEAETVRHIMERYLALGSAQLLVEELRQSGYRTRAQHGRGGIPFRRGALYYLLANLVYIGKVVHRGTVHDGEHEAIVRLELWTAVQNKIAGGRVSRPERTNVTHTSLLTGKLTDGMGRRMTPSHTAKGGRRYRYYVTHARDLVEGGPPVSRIPAHDLERLVIDRLAGLLEDRASIVDLLLVIDAHSVRQALVTSTRLARQFQRGDNIGPVIRELVDEVRISGDTVTITIQRKALLTSLDLESVDAATDEPLLITTKASRIRQHKDVRLIVATDDGVGDGTRNEPLVALLAEARQAYDAMLASPEMTIAEVAVAQGRCRKRMAKLLRIAFLAPDIVEQCLAGTQPIKFTTASLFSIGIPFAWNEQRAVFGFA